MEMVANDRNRRKSFSVSYFPQKNVLSENDMTLVLQENRKWNYMIENKSILVEN